MQNPWKIVFKGDLIAIEKHEAKGFERAVRPPGVRLILKNKEGEILLTKEFRDEQGKQDFRLPGGKVFNDLDSYLLVRGNQKNIDAAVIKAAKIEAKQEAGVDEIDNLVFFMKSIAGASVEWDLYYLVGDISKISGQDLEEDEKERGIDVGFYSMEQVMQMLKSGEISEDRSANVLYKYLLN
jgi:hypothetical protein